MTSTASGTVSARIRGFEYAGSPARDAEKAKRLEQFFQTTQLDEGTIRLIWSSNEPALHRPPGASWFRQVERRIAESSTSDPNPTQGGRWLPQATAIAALKFFAATSDLLPGEPYIYGSPLGDLVAEFDGEKGALTCVIGPNFTLLFVIASGKPFKVFVPAEGGEKALRSKLEELAELLRTGNHAALDTEH